MLFNMNDGDLDITYCVNECDRKDCYRHSSKMPDIDGIAYGYFKGKNMCPFRDETSIEDKFVNAMEEIVKEGIKNKGYQETLRELEKAYKLIEEIMEEYKRLDEGKVVERTINRRGTVNG